MIDDPETIARFEPHWQYWFFYLTLIPKIDFKSDWNDDKVDAFIFVYVFKYKKRG